MSGLLNCASTLVYSRFHLHLSISPSSRQASVQLHHELAMTIKKYSMVHCSSHFVWCLLGAVAQWQFAGVGNFWQYWGMAIAGLGTLWHYCTYIWACCDSLWPQLFWWGSKLLVTTIYWTRSPDKGTSLHNLSDGSGMELPVTIIACVPVVSSDTQGTTILYFNVLV